jgi:hypothetical protein
VKTSTKLMGIGFLAVFGGCGVGIGLHVPEAIFVGLGVGLQC